MTDTGPRVTKLHRLPSAHNSLKSLILNIADSKLVQAGRSSDEGQAPGTPLPSARGIASGLPFPEPCLAAVESLHWSRIKLSRAVFPRVALMETLKMPDTTRGEVTRIGKSIVIKGELSCTDDLYIDGQVEGAIDPIGNRLTIGLNGSVKANVNACVVVVQGKLEGDIQASDRVDLKHSAVVVGDIATQRISIDEGAYLKGNVNVQKEAPKKEGPDGIALSPSEAAQPRKRQ